MNKYSYPAMYRGIQIHKTCWAKSDSEASKKLNITIYMIRNYTSKYHKGDVFDDVKAYMDSGKIIFDFGRKDLMNKELPIKEIQSIIDQYQDKAYQKFKTQMGL
jgi:hypothetical protein